MLRRVSRPVFTISSRLCSANSRSDVQSNESIVPVYMNNRNPRNLERIRIAYKPFGFALDKPGKSYWHKLKLKVTSKYVFAYVDHFQNGNIIEASTNEWAIKKHLYSTTDISAFVNLGRVLAQRCLMMGITEMRFDVDSSKSTKLKLFKEELEKGGVMLREPTVFKTPEPLDDNRPEKPWEVTET